MWSSRGHLSWNALTCYVARKVHGVEFSRVSLRTTGAEWTLVSLWTWGSPRNVFKLLNEFRFLYQMWNDKPSMGGGFCYMAAHYGFIKSAGCFIFIGKWLQRATMKWTRNPHQCHVVCMYCMETGEGRPGCRSFRTLLITAVMTLQSSQNSSNPALFNRESGTS